MSEISPSPETDRIADQLQRAMKGGAWHGPDLAVLLSDVNAAAAAAQAEQQYQAAQQAFIAADKEGLAELDAQGDFLQLWFFVIAAGTVARK